MSGEPWDSIAAATVRGGLRLTRNAASFLHRGVTGRGWSPIRLLGGYEEVLVPGDPTPPGDAAGDFRDYRGIAEPRELGRLRSPEGFPLGRYWYPNGRRGPALQLPHEELFRNCLVVGPPGAGKTEGVIVPWIRAALSTGASVVTVDVKGDLHGQLRSDLGGCRSWYWNPFDPSGSQSWNWLGSLRSLEDVHAAVLSLLGRKRPGDPQPYFHERDVRWLTALIRLVHRRHGRAARLADLYALVADQGRLEEAVRAVRRADDLEADLSSLLRMSAPDHVVAVGGLANALSHFSPENVRDVTERSDFDLHDLGTRPTLLVVGAPLSAAIPGEVLSSVFLSQLLTTLFRRFSATGASTSRRPIFLILDEAPRYRDRIDLDQLLAVGRSARIGVCLAAQDVSQFGGADSQAAVLATCATTVVLPGASPATAQAFSRAMGLRAECERSANPDEGLLGRSPGRRAETWRSVLVPVLNDREIMHPPVGPFSAVVLAKSISRKPFLVDLHN